MINKQFLKRRYKFLRRFYLDYPIVFSFIVVLLPTVLSFTAAYFTAERIGLAFGSIAFGRAFDLANFLLVFWVTLLILSMAVIYGIKVIEERADKIAKTLKQDERFSGIAIIPNLRFFFALEGKPQDEAFTILSKHFSISQVPLVSLTTPEIQQLLDKVATDLRLAIKECATLAYSFGGADLRVDVPRYGGSIMLAVEPNAIDDLPEQYRTQPLLSHETEQLNPNRSSRKTGGLLRFAGVNVDVRQLDAILILPADLLYKGESDERDRSVETVSVTPYPSIALPMVKAAPEQLLPGAPTALASGDVSGYGDTRRLVDDYCSAFSKRTRDEISEYFSEDGDGSSIRSFISIRIGLDENDPIGVISLDANIPNFLGARKEHYDAFATLFRPMIHAFRPAMRSYTKYWWELQARKASDQA